MSMINEPWLPNGMPLRSIAPCLVEGTTPMLPIAPGWNLEVSRGPDWLFVTLHCEPEFGWDPPPLADTLWSLLEQHFTRRLVLECDELPQLNSMLIGELITLNKRLQAGGGVLRLCGL